MQVTVEEWEKEWQVAAEKFELVKQALKNSQCSEVLSLENQVHDILYWRSKTNKLVERARASIKPKTEYLLEQAYSKAKDKNFTAALD